MSRPLGVVIMAAGKGTRMNNPDMAKVMFTVGNKPMIHHVVDRSLDCEARKIVVIIGYNRESVREYLEAAFGDTVEFAVQDQQLGTGHAVMQAEPSFKDFEGDILVLSGDVPLLTTGSLRNLIALHHDRKAAATVLTVIAPDPTGYGRVIRDESGSVAKIVEHKDATEDELKVDEINSGIYVFRSADLLEALPHLGNDNAQGEYYLPDVVEWLQEQGRSVAAYASGDYGEIHGINTPEQLAMANQEFAERIAN